VKTIMLFCLCAGVALAGVTANLDADEIAPTNTTETILRHPGFREGLVWIGKEPTEKENASLLRIVDDLNKSYSYWPSEVDKFLEDFPESPWASSLHYAYAQYCHETGRTTRALQHWEAAWNLVKDDTSTEGRRLGGEILAQWTEQLSSLGRRDKLRELIAVGDKWPFANRLDRERFQSAKHNYLLMGRHPEISYRCGTLALKAVGLTLEPTNTALQSLVEIGSPVDGFSMSGLAELTKQYGLDLVAVRRTQGDDLIVPSLIHWRQNHYAAILKREGDTFLINDPTFGKPRWMQREAINEEASGCFLIPVSKQTAHWQTLGAVELASIHGKGLYNSINDALDKGCTTVTGNAQDCGCTSPATGMPVWWVSEPYNNLWIADEPISYLTSTGEKFTFRITYKERGLGPEYPYPIPYALGANGSDTFNPWGHSWFSYIAVVNTNLGGQFPVLTNCFVTIGLPNGGEVDFTPGQNYDPETRILLRQVDPTTSLSTQWPHSPGGYASSSADNGDNGLRVVHADGSQDIYAYGLFAYLPSQYYASEVVYMLSRHIDPAGRTTTYIYGGLNNELLYVVDPDGLTNTLTYTSITNGSAGGYVLTKVSNPYGLTAQLKYDNNDNLTNIIDAQGLSSYINYDTNANPTKLITPYGTNTFALYENAAAASTNDTDGNFGTDSYVDRAEVVTDPVGGIHLYLYQFDCGAFMATNFASGDVPTNTPIGTLDSGTGSTNSISGINFRNSFSWDARQYAALSTTNFLSLTTNDYLRGRMKHWLEDTNNLYLSENVSVERDPSPDGTTEGLKTFYDYQGKVFSYQAGTNPVPSVTSWRLPGGETHYEYVQYDYFGNVTNRVTTYTTTSGTWGTRTNQYFFANNVYTYIFYASYLDSNGLYDIYLPFSTNTFAIPNLLTRIVAANGSNDWTFGPYDVIAWTNFFFDEPGQSNEFVLSSQRVLPDFTTNGLNQTTAFTFANYNLIASIQWPSGLTTTNIYNSSGFLDHTTDVQINRTRGYTYSANGMPSAYTNELGLTVDLFWDNLLRLAGTYFPVDGTTTSNVYTALDVTASKDRLGHWTSFGYDGLRHLKSITRTNDGNLTNRTTLNWCDCGALTDIYDGLTNHTAFGYDYQSRLTSIAFPDSSSASYLYDLSGRMTSAADGAGAFLEFSFNNQGLITNANNNYGIIFQMFSSDILDRPIQVIGHNNVIVSFDYDALNRVVDRVWQDLSADYFVYSTNGLAAYTNQDNQATYFGRDAAGRLTSVTNANIEVTHFAYDPASNITNLVDGLSHNTGWGYNQFGWRTSAVDNSGNQSFRFYYDANGRLTNRWTPGTTNTTYTYDAEGNLTNISYPGAASPTAAISFAYDLVNRLTNMVDGIGTTGWGYTGNNLLASETGPWSGTAVAYLYSQQHRISMAVTSPASTLNFSNTYDATWRIQSLISPAGTFGYTYATLTNFSLTMPSFAPGLVASIGLPNGGLITNQYGFQSRLTNTSLANYWGHVLDGYGYGYDPLGLRINISRYLGITTNNVSVGYDNISQITSWSGQESSGTFRANEHFTYGYDAAHNLAARTNSALAQTFNPDNLNQLSTISRSSSFTLAGATPTIASNITVDGNPATTYGDLTFAKRDVALADGANSFTVVAENIYGVSATNAFTVNLPATVSFQYDTNGNLISDGTRSFVYDAENQLTNVYVTNQWMTQFAYDGLRRKRIERDFAWSGSAWAETNETHYIYDGMLVVQERASNNAVNVTYTRGPDLSGSLQGAGGIGGLLARTDPNGSTFYHSDGNGNITALMDGNQNIVARYEYDPYGRLIGKWGTMADVNHYRFSSQEFFPNPNIYGYHSRFYDPTLQRWLNRDPFGEAGGLNLYGFVGNNPVGNVDPYGLAVGDWWDPRTYSTSYANAAGASAVQAQLERAGYQSMNEFNLAQRTFQGTFTSGDMSTVQAGAGVAGTGAAIYVNGITMIGQGGIITKGEEAAAQGIADATEQGWLSKLWGKCKFWGKEPPPKPRHFLLGHGVPGFRTDAATIGAEHLLDANPATWQQEFLQLVKDPSTQFTIRLDNFVGNSVEEMINNELQIGQNTAWEIQQLQNAGRLPEVNFIQGGQSVPNPYAK